MMRSLTMRLALAFGLVVILAVGAVAFLARQTAVAQLESFVTGGAQMRAERMAPDLADYYVQNGGWEGLQTSLGGMTTTMPGIGRGRGTMGPSWRFAGMMPYRILVADSAGVIVADTGTVPQLGESLAAEELALGQPIFVDGRPVGTVLVLYESSEIESALAEEYRRSLDRAVLIAGIVVGGIAIILALFLSRGILAPLGHLRQASQRIAAGDYSERVPVSGQDELGEVAVAFNSMAASLERGQNLRRQWIADITHELRTPISVLRADLEALLDGVRPMTAENIALLLDDVLLLSRLTEDLRQLALAEAGQLELHREPVDMPRFLDEMRAKLSSVADSQGVTFSVEVVPGTPPALADAGRLNQIFFNLVSNALRHTPAGGSVMVEVQPAPGSPGWLRARVTDTGEGIPAEELPHIFDRFYRGDRARRRQYGGSGLGLAIVQELVHAHGGTITVHSELGAGTTFELTLPAAG